MEPAMTILQSPTSGLIQPPGIVKVIRRLCIILPALIAVAWLSLVCYVHSQSKEDTIGPAILGIVVLAIVGLNTNLYRGLGRGGPKIWHSVFAMLCIGMIALFPIGAIVNGILLRYWVKPETKAWFHAQPTVDPVLVNPSTEEVPRTSTVMYGRPVPISTDEKDLRLAPQIVRSIRWIYGLAILLGVLGVFLVASPAEASGSDPIVRVEGVWLIVLGLASILQWWCLVRRVKVGWYGQVVQSILMLPGFPLGTVIGGYTLYYWFQPDVKVWYGMPLSRLVDSGGPGCAPG